MEKRVTYRITGLLILLIFSGLLMLLLQMRPSPSSSQQQDPESEAVATQDMMRVIRPSIVDAAPVVNSNSPLAKIKLNG